MCMDPQPEKRSPSRVLIRSSGDGLRWAEDAQVRELAQTELRRGATAVRRANMPASVTMPRSSSSGAPTRRAADTSPASGGGIEAELRCDRRQAAGRGLRWRRAATPTHRSRPPTTRAESRGRRRRGRCSRPSAERRRMEPASSEGNARNHADRGSAGADMAHITSPDQEQPPAVRGRARRCTIAGFAGGAPLWARPLRVTQLEGFHSSCVTG